MAIRKRASIAVAAFACFVASGCVALPIGAELSNRVSDFVTSVHERQQLAVDAMRMRRQATVEELRVENDRIRDEIKDGTERHRAEALMERDALRTQYDEKIHTQLGVQISQQFQLGQLQVDEKQLKELLEKREKEHEALTESYNLLEKDRKQRLRQQYLKQAQAELKMGNRGKAEALMEQAACCSIAAPDCAQPLQEKLQNQEALTQPIKQPLLPTEIPLQIPVTLKLELGGPAMSKLEVKRIPRAPNEALKECKPKPGACCTTAEGPAILPCPPAPAEKPEEIK